MSVSINVATHEPLLYIRVFKDPDYFQENMEIHVKISMDGAQYTKKSSFTLLSFSIFTREYTLSPTSKLRISVKILICAYTYVDIHTVAVMKADENYHNLAESFKNVFEEINHMVENPYLTIDEQSYTVIFAVITRHELYSVQTIYGILLFK